MQDEKRMLHAVFRVGDLDKTIDYYTKFLGMEKIRYRDIPEVCLALAGCLMHDSCLTQ